MTDLRRPERLNIGRVISRAFGAIGPNFGSFFVISLIFSAIPGFAISYAYSFYGIPMLSQVGDGATMTSFVGLIANFLTSLPAYIATGAITHGSIVHFNGAKAPLGDCLQTGIRKFLPLFAVGVLTTIGVAFGAILLIIPGIIVAIALSVSTPALVVENTGVFGSMTRSANLTENNRWAIFGLIVICLVVIMLIGLVVGAILVALIGGGFRGESGVVLAGSEGLVSWGATGVSLLGDALSTTIGAAGVASLYYELRTNKEGASSDDLARVFD